MESPTAEPYVRESTVGWSKGSCRICRSTPVKWRVDLTEPDHQGRLVAFFCERHEENKNMLVAQLQWTWDEDVAA